MKHNAKKRTLRLEQLENRALLSATTWDNAAQADAAVAAEMAAILNETAPIDLTSAFSSAAETEAPLEIEVDTTAQDAAAQLKDAVEQIAEGGVITLANGGTIELSEVLTITKTLSIVADDNATILNQEGCGFAVSNSATLEVSGVCFENPSSDLFNVVSGASAIVRDSVFSGEFGEWVIELDEGGAYKSIGNIYNQTDGPALFHVGDGSQIDMANDVVRTTTALVNGKNVSGVEITVTNSTIDLQDQDSSIVNGIEGTVTLNNSLLIGVVNVKSGTVNANNVLIYGSFTGKAEENLNNVAALDSTDGLFVDYAQGDYRLVEGSKAIEAGNNDYVVDLVKDLAGNNRIAGNNVDLGAYEYGAGPYVELTPPSAPENVRFEDFDFGDYTSSTSLPATAFGKIVWNDMSDVEEYFLVRVTTDKANWPAEADWIRVDADTTVADALALRQATTYYFQVCAVNAAGQSAWADGEYTTPLAAPGEAEFAYYDAEKQTLEISWKDNSDGEEKFVVEYTKNGSEWKPCDTLGEDENSRIGWLVWADAEYEYRVKAVKGDIVSDWSPVTKTIIPGQQQFEEPTFTPPATVPAAPTDLEFIGANEENRGFELSWTDNSTNEDYFIVECSKDGGATWEEAARLGKNDEQGYTWQFNNYNTWSYRVYALNAVGASGYSNVVTIPATVFAPAAPTNLTLGVYNEATRQLEMSWTDNSSDEEYFVVEYSKNGSDWQVAGRVGQDVTSRLGYGVTLNNEWKYRVCAVNAAGSSAYSNVVSITPTASVPVAPTNLTLGFYNEATRQLEMSWTDNSFNEDYFVVEYSKNGSDWKEAGRVGKNVTSRLGYGVAANTDWSYRVYAVNSSGRSAYSNVETFNSSDRSTDVVSEAFADVFVEDVEDDFWFEFEKALGARK